jgi:murein DD-endopeptidase MepM/ murein hydrolase activator NlpD
MLTLPRHWFLGFLLLLLLFVGAFYYFKREQSALPIVPLPSSTPLAKVSPVESLSGIEPPSASPTLTPQPGSVFPTPPPSFVGELQLLIPVAGVSREQLLDTFTDARSEGRTHDAIDIAAPAGTPVVAAAEGEVIRLFYSERGGTTVYQLTADRRLVLYYAHLQRYADGLVEGRYARQGEVLAYVGDSGNAGAGNYHLHFSVAVVADPKRYWEGTNINPFPLLRNP